jgi:hypothetical protein
MDSTDALRSSVLTRVQQRLREVLTSLPRLLADKLLLGNAPADEVIDLGQLRVITGSKYRQYCRAKYGPSYLENLAEKYLSETDTSEGSNQSVARRRAARFYRSLLGKVAHTFLPSISLTQLHHQIGPRAPSGSRTVCGNGRSYDYCAPTRRAGVIRLLGLEGWETWRKADRVFTSTLIFFKSLPYKPSVMNHQETSRR